MSDLSPRELLSERVVLNLDETAVVLRLLKMRGANKGKPDRAAVFQMVRDHKLPLVDPSQPVTRWTISVDAVKRYIGVEQVAS